MSFDIEHQVTLRDETGALDSSPGQQSDEGSESRSWIGCCCSSIGSCCSSIGSCCSSIGSFLCSSVLKIFLILGIVLYYLGVVLGYVIFITVGTAVGIACGAVILAAVLVGLPALVIALVGIGVALLAGALGIAVAVSAAAVPIGVAVVLGLPVLIPLGLIVVFSLPKKTAMRITREDSPSKEEDLAEGIAGAYNRALSKEQMWDRIMIGSLGVTARISLGALLWVALSFLVPRLRALTLLGSPMWKWSLLGATLTAGYFQALTLILPVLLWRGSGATSYYLNALLLSISHVAHMGLVMGTWLAYFRTPSGLNNHHRHHQAFEYVTWSVVSLFAGSIFLLFKNLLLLRWGAEAIYRRFGPRVLITSLKFYFIARLAAGVDESSILEDLNVVEQYGDPDKNSKRHATVSKYVMSRKMNLPHLRYLIRMFISLTQTISPLVDGEGDNEEVVDWFKDLIKNDTSDTCTLDGLLKLFADQDVATEPPELPKSSSPDVATELPESPKSSSPVVATETPELPNSSSPDAATEPPESPKSSSPYVATETPNLPKSSSPTGKVESVDQLGKGAAEPPSDLAKTDNKQSLPRTLNRLNTLTRRNFNANFNAAKQVLIRQGRGGEIIAAAQNIFTPSRKSFVDATQKIFTLETLYSFISPKKKPEEEDKDRYEKNKRLLNVLWRLVGEECSSHAFTFQDLKMWMADAHKDCINMGRTLADAEAIVTRLDIFLSFVIFLIVLLLWLLITGLSSTKILVTIGTPFLALTFIFGDSAKLFFQGFIFYFATHPFDVGDRCILNGVELEVRSVSILTTTFIKIGSKEKRMYPNSILSTEAIVNIGWQPDPKDVVELPLSASTNLDELQKRVKKFFEEEESKLYGPEHEMVISEVGENIKVKIYFTHTLTVHDLSHSRCFQKKRSQRSKFLSVIKKHANELRIEQMDVKNPSQSSASTTRENEELMSAHK